MNKKHSTKTITPNKKIYNYLKLKKWHRPIAPWPCWIGKEQ
jgi:hypothetical protein